MRRLVVLVCFGLLLAAAPLAAQLEQPPPEVPPYLGEPAEHGQHEHSDFWKIANFLILASVLGYFIYRYAGRFFNARTDQIRHGLEEAARVKAEAEARYAEIERRLANLGADIENLRRAARDESAAESERVRQETEREALKIRALAERDIAAAAKAARQQLRAYSAELAVDLAKQKIRAQLTPQAESELVQSMVAQLDRRAAVQPAGRL